MKINTLAAVATTNKSVVADKTAGVLDQSEKKSLPAKIAWTLKYQVPSNPPIAKNRKVKEIPSQFCFMQSDYLKKLLEPMPL